jgi:pimeloyl-ACP methyl ester carboxylesterase
MNPFGSVHNFAQFFAQNGYQASELWGLGYQGDQCDLLQDQTLRSGIAHSTAAAVPLLRAFVHAVLAYTGAHHVDIVAHSLGVTVAREWMLQDNAYRMVRSLVAIDGPNHGIVDCSPSPGNFFNQPANGGFIPNSAICDEYGAANTQFLTALNAGGETPGPTKYLVIRNIFDASPESGDFVYIGGALGWFLRTASGRRSQRQRSRFFRQRAPGGRTYDQPSWARTVRYDPRNRSSRNSELADYVGGCAELRR